MKVYKKHIKGKYNNWPSSLSWGELVLVCFIIYLSIKNEGAANFYEVYEKLLFLAIPTLVVVLFFALISVKSRSTPLISFEDNWLRIKFYTGYSRNIRIDKIQRVKESPNYLLFEYQDKKCWKIRRVVSLRKTLMSLSELKDLCVFLEENNIGNKNIRAKLIDFEEG